MYIHIRIVREIKTRGRCFSTQRLFPMIALSKISLPVCVILLFEATCCIRIVTEVLNLIFVWWEGSSEARQSGRDQRCCLWGGGHQLQQTICEWGPVACSGSTFIHVSSETGRGDLTLILIVMFCDSRSDWRQQTAEGPSGISGGSKRWQTTICRDKSAKWRRALVCMH